MEIEIDCWGDLYYIRDRNSATVIEIRTWYLNKIAQFLTPSQYEKFITDETVLFKLSKKRTEILLSLNHKPQ